MLIQGFSMSENVCVPEIMDVYTIQYAAKKKDNKSAVKKIFKDFKPANPALAFFFCPGVQYQ